MKRLVTVDILALTFGIGAWVAINGLWVELPLLVQELPEGWSLPSYLSVIVQMANIGPISYSIVRTLRPSTSPTKVIYGVLSIGCLSTLLLSNFWSSTSMVGGTMHSTALLVLVFFLALVDCTSSVLFIPYMAVWRSIYLPSYLVGEGMSGLLPAIVALGQGVGGETTCLNTTDGSSYPEPLEPNFSIDIFFYIIFGMMIASTLGFIMLQFLPWIQSERVSKQANLSVTVLSSPQEPFDSRCHLMEPNPKRLTNSNYALLLFVQAWSSMLSNGFMPSIQSYSCGPYGNVTYHLAATLSALANPLAALATMILPRSKPKLVGVLSIIGTLVSFYGIATAVMSPTPPWMDQTLGAILIVLTWVLFIGIITYVRVEIANILRQYGERPLFWSGAITQVGSTVGAIIAFFLVNKSDIFTSYNPCS